jgi:hypothetical protein
MRDVCTKSLRLSNGRVTEKKLHFAIKFYLGVEDGKEPVVGKGRQGLASLGVIGYSKRKKDA